MADISKELEAWRSAQRGRDVRQAQIDLSIKLNTEVEAGTDVIQEYTENESQRIKNEAARVAAEAQRVEEFASSKTDCDAATNRANAAAEDCEGLTDNRRVSELERKVNAIIQALENVISIS